MSKEVPRPHRFEFFSRRLGVWSSKMLISQSTRKCDRFEDILPDISRSFYNSLEAITDSKVRASTLAQCSVYFLLETFKKLDVETS